MMTTTTHTRRRPDRGGFTLIELLIVIAIIGILASLLIVVIPKVKQKVYETQTHAQLVAIAAACQQYYNDFRAYPGPIPNNLLGGSFYATPASANITSLGATTAAGTVYTAGGFTPAMAQHVTGSENLVLGLLGALNLDTTSAQNANGTYQVAYNPNDLFPDGTTPNPKGPAGLNPANPKRYSPYMQVRAGDLSQPTGSSFADQATRTGTDSMIPEFLDKFANPMPILYLRCNVAATGVVSRGGKDETGANAIRQYELAHVLDYTSSQIGLNPNSALSYHGLQDVAPTAPANSGQPMSDSVAQDYALPGTVASHGANALVYLKDPSTPNTLPDGTTAMTNARATARQKDAFLLISPGPDGVYGTADDIIYPGGSVTP